MADTLQLKVVTPSGSIIDEAVASFTGASDLGEFCILPEHRPMLASLVAGRMIIEKTDGAKAMYALDTGFLEAGKDHVNVITERCISAEALDQAALRKELEELESSLSDLDLGAPEAEELLRDRAWVTARLSIIE